MKPQDSHLSYSIGWDVGGWNCDRNSTSRDAIVILDSALKLVGQPWRGNLRECISTATTTGDWLEELFARCQAEIPRVAVNVTMAIDTPLGFPDSLVRLITEQEYVEPDEICGLNRYLFRETECYLFAQGLKPLSAIKDMIGSQATKGMHFLAKFTPQIEECGVWTDGHDFRVIETYPTACRGAKTMKALLKRRKPLGHPDKDDALICALIAHLFASDRDSLEGPHANVPSSEGWIWVPRRERQI